MRTEEGQGSERNKTKDSSSGAHAQGRLVTTGLKRKLISPEEGKRRRRCLVFK